MINKKEEMLTDVSNLMNRRIDELELMVKKLENTNALFVKCMQQIKDMAEEKDAMQKQLEDLQKAAQVVIDMVDPPEEGVIDNRILLEGLQEAPQKIAGFISKTTRTYVAHVLGLFKSFWPKANLEPLADGMAADCSQERFTEYLKEVESVAQKIVESLEQDWKQ
jgi:phage gp36-like protein